MECSSTLKQSIFTLKKTKVFLKYLPSQSLKDIVTFVKRHKFEPKVMKKLN